MPVHTLLLNTGFEPLRIITWQKAFVLLFQGKVEVLEQYVVAVHTVSKEFQIPAVIKLTRWVNLSKFTPVVRFSRTNVYVRDEFRCQYCHKKFPERELTLDHVKPVVHGGKKTWENIVAACKRCNQKKRDLSPEEAGLILYRQPTIPRGLPGIFGYYKINAAPDVWQPYLNLIEKRLKAENEF